MLSANFKPKRTTAASRGFLATTWLSCLVLLHFIRINVFIMLFQLLTCRSVRHCLGHMNWVKVIRRFVGQDMAYVLKSGIRVFSQFQTVSVKSHRLASLQGLISRRWVAAGSSEHTLAVRQQIQDTRKKGQEAGGEKRIQSQHKKVVNQ